MCKPIYKSIPATSQDEELQELLAGCRVQDRRHQKELYKSFYGFAMSICLRYAGNRYEAVEVLNQGFLKVFMNLNKFTNEKPFKAWLGRIMINTSINYYRSNLKMAQMDDLEKAEGLSQNELPDSKLTYDDLIAMVHRLPPAYRTVFNLYAIEGYTHNEIGELLDINEGTSKSNLFKARDKLKRMILESERLPDVNSGSSYNRYDDLTDGGDLNAVFLFITI
jgi:RNA polymerase sigma factor (sigma-70 family)